MNKIVKLMSFMVVPLLLLSGNTKHTNTINKLHAEDNVCSLTTSNGTSGYTSVFEALKVASETGGTVSLSSNFEESWTSSIQIEEGKEVTFDLNGFTYSEKSLNKYLRVGGTFTLNDSSMFKTGTWNYKDSTGDYFDNKIRFINNSENGIININGGNITNFEPLISPNEAKVGVINVSGGNFSAPLFTSIMDSSIQWNIKGGTYSSNPVNFTIDKGSLDVTMGGDINGLNLSLPRTSVNNHKLNLTVNDVIYNSKSKPVVLNYIHDEYGDIDGTKLATIDCDMKSTKVFELRITDTNHTNEKDKHNIKDWKVLIYSKQLVIKPIDFINPEEQEDKKIVKQDENGHTLTFIGEYSDLDKSKISKAQFIVSTLPISNEYRSLIANSANYSSYRIMDAIDVKVLSENNQLLELENRSKYYISLNVTEEFKGFDKFLVVDESLNTYTTTVNNGKVTFATGTNAHYIIIATGEIHVNYLLGLIIPLGVLIVLELAFVSYMLVRRMFRKKKEVVNSISLGVLFLFTELWGGAIPLVIVEAVAVIGLGILIYFLVKKEFFDNKDK